MVDFDIHHVAPSVRDIRASAEWYERVFELEKAAELDQPAPLIIYRTPGGQAIDLRQDPEVGTEAFTQTHTGLDHIALTCGGRPALEKWRARLNELAWRTPGSSSRRSVCT